MRGSNAGSWMSGPQEQMLSEAYAVEKKRQNAIANLNNAHNSQMDAINQRHKQGRFANEQEYLKVSNAEVEKYNKKRTNLDKQYDRETGKIVGPQNVDATRRLYQMEERLKESRLKMINAIMKMIDVIMKLVLLPLTILGMFNGDALKASGGEKAGKHTENLNDQINRMTKEMEQAAKRMEDFAKSINDIANPILYTIYVMSHFIAFLKGIINWAVNPVNWFTKEVPNPTPEGYETWLDKNAKGEDHYDASKLKDNSLKVGYDWLASGNAWKDTEAGIKDIPNQIKSGIKGTGDSIKGGFQYIVGTPQRIWNDIFGPKEKQTPEEKRMKEEAIKAGKKPGEYFQTQEADRNEEAAKEKGEKVQPTPDNNLSIENQRKQGMKYKLHSPLTLTSGMTGFLGGEATKIIFPQLDPIEFVSLAEKTAKQVTAKDSQKSAINITTNSLLNGKINAKDSSPTSFKLPEVSSIKFPQLDMDKLAEKIKSTEQNVTTEKVNGGIVITNLIIERAKDDPDEIQRVLRIGLKDLARELEGL